MTDKQHDMPTADSILDQATTAIYRQFKEWNRRKFSADDVTWCEVRSEIEKIIIDLVPKAPFPDEMLDRMPRTKEESPNLHKLMTEPSILERPNPVAWKHWCANGQSLHETEDSAIQKRDDFGGVVIPLYTDLRPAVDLWGPIETAPKDGTPMSAYRTVRYLPYKIDGKRQMKVNGRWQEFNGYGWTNCDEPNGWRPLPPTTI
jgi:hypothetical protein